MITNFYIIPETGMAVFYGLATAFSFGAGYYYRKARAKCLKLTEELKAARVKLEQSAEQLNKDIATLNREIEAVRKERLPHA